jgi:hypothetical protein
MSSTVRAWHTTVSVFLIERDMSAGTTTLSQKHHAEDILRTNGFWGSLSLATMIPPYTRLSKDDPMIVILIRNEHFTCAIVVLWAV